MAASRSVDWMSIGIEKQAETDSVADYAFVSDVWEPDPRFRSRSRIVGQNRGLLRVTKKTGDVSLLIAMPEDDDGKRFYRAAQRIKKHWLDGEYPSHTMYACA